MRKIVSQMRHHPVQKRVALAVYTGITSGRAVALGVARFAEEVGNWHLICGDEMRHPAELRRVASVVDGLIVASPDEDGIAVCREVCRRIPVILVGDERPGLISVVPDDTGIGRAAYRHLRSLGLTRFATMGIAGAGFSDKRVEGFIASAREDASSTGGQPAVARYPNPIYNSIHADPHEAALVCDFLRQLRYPVGLFATTATVASIAVQFLHDLGRHVPQDAAVIGVTDDDLACELCRPRLSAIDDATRPLGYEAARVLGRLFAGEPAPDKPVVVPCGNVAVAGSTDLLAVDQPDIAAAVRFIRQHATQGIRVSQVLANVPVSRRTLERGFAKHLGRSLHDEIIRVKVDEASRLLRNTDLPMKEIAARCGFSDDSKLSTVFKQSTGMTPRDYRRRTTLG